VERVLRYLAFALCPFAFGCRAESDEVTIVVIPKGLTHEHWQSVRRGAERCANEMLSAEGVRVRVIFDGPLRERDAIEQIRIVDRRLATGARGIVLAPQHSRTMTACVKRAADAGVPVVVIDSGLAEPEHFVKYVATNNYEGGCLAAKHLHSRLPEEKKQRPRLILFRYAVGSESTDERERGFEETMQRICPGAIWLSTDKYAGSTRDSAMREAGPLVLQFGDQVDAIFAPNESSASGMLDVLRSHGLNRKVLLMAFDASKPLLQAIQEGDVVGSILQDPYRMGYVSTLFCVRHVLGDDVNPPGSKKEYYTGEHVVIEKNGQLITTTNADPDFVRGLYDPEAQAARTIETPPYLKNPQR
jgi:ribose transport system substrate-binding protein